MLLFSFAEFQHWYWHGWGYAIFTGSAIALILIIHWIDDAAIKRRSLS